MNDRFFPASKPRAVEGGLKARSKRGAIAQTWWSGRFIAVLEDMGLGGRLQRGRRYARTGQVIDMQVAAGLVSAQVQGSRVKPYRVRISIAAYDKAQWARLERALAEKAWYAAQLLSGEMPDDLEKVFAEAGLPLFPAAGKDMSMDCSCPDWGVPCKHVAAVCYLLAESFDDDPFRILAWRGREREDLLTNLRALAVVDTEERSGRSRGTRRWATGWTPSSRRRRRSRPTDLPSSRPTPCCANCRRSRWRCGVFRWWNCSAPHTCGWRARWRDKTSIRERLGVDFGEVFSIDRRARSSGSAWNRSILPRVFRGANGSWICPAVPTCVMRTCPVRASGRAVR